ncbi:MAG: hypothetical protein KAJ19_16300 [Gammaproteobacteria bacterium]|nr:hypothetical protein [Gammaproteobacteria bacterium]
MFVALKRQSTVPMWMLDVYTLWATGVIPTLVELDQMPQNMVDRYILMKAVADVATYGGTLNL